jgi:hypothetical protein
MPTIMPDVYQFPSTSASYAFPEAGFEDANRWTAASSRKQFSVSSQVLLEQDSYTCETISILLLLFYDA